MAVVDCFMPMLIERTATSLRLSFPCRVRAGVLESKTARSSEGATSGVGAGGGGEPLLGRGEELAGGEGGGVK